MMDDLTGLQKRRLASALGEAVGKRRDWYLSQITGAPPHVQEKLRLRTEEMDSAFQALLAARGLCSRDLVRVTTEGPCSGREVEVVSVDRDGRIFVDMGGDLRPFQAEMLMLVEAKPKGNAKVRRVPE